VTPTADQLKALKGDSKLPGYTADYGDLHVGQTITVHLARRKAVENDKEASNKSDKPKWIPLGEITGRVVQIEGQAAPAIKGKGKKNEEPRRVEQRLTVEVDSVALARHVQKPGNNKVTLGEDVLAVWVMIQSSADADREAGK
jgi:hypothetical protein